MKRSLIGLVFTFFTVFSLAATVGEPAPNISLRSANGDVSQLSDYKGQVVYLDFWASWCKPCQRSFPWMNEVHNKLADKGLKVIAINLDVETALADQFLAKLPADFAIAYDPEGESAEAYRVLGMPSSYLIDKKGILREVHQGFFATKVPLYEKQLDVLLAE